MNEQFPVLLKGLRPIALNEIGSVMLMTRADEKYQCNIGQLPEILKKAEADFQILEHRGTLLQGYETLYLDTPDHRMYLDHHNGKLNRYKIRIRQYRETGEFFLEVKRRDNHLRTEKKRIPVTPDYNILDPRCRQFIMSESPFDPGILKPTLVSSFSRITLVNLNRVERITIDILPAWQAGQKRIEMPDLVIIEVKSARKAGSEGFGLLLREERIFPKRLSKYCMGNVLLYPEIKHNRFKAKLLHLEKLSKPTFSNESVPAIT